MNWVYSAGFMLPLLLAAAACSRQEAASPAAPGAATGELNACALVTREDVAAIAGMAAKEVKPGIGSAMTSECTFVAEDASTVDVLIRKSTARYDVDAEIAGMKKAMPGTPVRETSGIGDRAYFMGSQLNVYRGDVYILVSMLGFSPDPKTDEAARKLAQKALSQL